jgi:CRP-like cAMP-binding protein
MESHGCLACAARRACILAEAGRETLLELQPRIRTRRLHARERVEVTGVQAHAVAVLKTGTAFVVRRGLDGMARPIALAGRGAATGLLRWFGFPDSETMQAVSAARVCEIAHADLSRAVRHEPALEARLMRRAVEGMGVMAGWSEAMRVRGVVNQLAYTLLLLVRTEESSRIRLPAHAALGELLGTTRESVARAFGTLRDEGGLVPLEGRLCEIDREQLLLRLRTHRH